MKSIMILFYAINLICIMSAVQAEIACGFPGVPYNGAISNEKEIYKIGEVVTYSCLKSNMVLQGKEEIKCIYPGIWNQDKIPQCLVNLAYRQTASQSSTIMDAQRALDLDVMLCSRIDEIISKDSGFWEVSLNREFTIVGIFYSIISRKTSPKELQVLVGNHHNDSFKLCNVIVTYEVFGDSLYSKEKYLPCIKEMTGSIVRIENPINTDLCLIHVYMAEELRCGIPDVHASCQIEFDMTSPQKATYKAKPGFILEGASKLRTCINGSWSDSTPFCEPVSATTAVELTFIVIIGLPILFIINIFITCFVLRRRKNLKLQNQRVCQHLNPESLSQQKIQSEKHEAGLQSFLSDVIYEEPQFYDNVITSNNIERQSINNGYLEPKRFYDVSSINSQNFRYSMYPDKDENDLKTGNNGEIFSSESDNGSNIRGYIEPQVQYLELIK